MLKQVIQIRLNLPPGMYSRVGFSHLPQPIRPADDTRKYPQIRSQG
uniref:Uncharacterized protein n=1 Tax=Arundo donax TaxID=35708 RepID=A0A0A8ZGW6_ARUDO